MMSYKSFIDVLFILLLGTMVLLTQSVQIGAIDTVMARMGAGGISPVRADEVQIVVVSESELKLGDRTFTDIKHMAPLMNADAPVLLVTADAEVRHHRVMEVWMELAALDLDVKLGAQPAPAKET